MSCVYGSPPTLFALSFRTRNHDCLGCNYSPCSLFIPFNGKGNVIRNSLL